VKALASATPLSWLLQIGMVRPAGYGASSVGLRKKRRGSRESVLFDQKLVVIVA